MALLVNKLNREYAAAPWPRINEIHVTLEIWVMLMSEGLYHKNINIYNCANEIQAIFLRVLSVVVRKRMHILRICIH